MSNPSSGSRGWTLAAYVAVALGVATILWALLQGPWSWALVGLALIIPAAWHFYASRHDAKERAFYEESVRAFQVTGGDMSLIAKPRYLERRWVPVFVGCAILAGTGVGLVDDAGHAPSGGMYADCDEAFDAGRANIARDEEGYHPALDRDSDGIACEAN